MFFVDTWAELGKFMDSGGMVLLGHCRAAIRDVDSAV